MHALAAPGPEQCPVVASYAEYLIGPKPGASYTHTTPGGPGDPDPPPPPPVQAPEISSFAPAAAWRGDSLTLTGEHFGDEQGTVTVGGVPAEVTEWTDGRVAATLPPGAQRGWQQMTITNPHGTHTVNGLFVGVEFTGADDELQTFLNEQESGMAVLLQARTYSVGAGLSSFVVSNLHLYGRGADESELAMETTGDMSLVVAFGGKISLNDLAVSGGTVRLRSDALSTASTEAGSDSPVRPRSRALNPAGTTTSLSTSDLQELRTSARSLMEFRNVRLTDSHLRTSGADHPALFDVRLVDSEFTRSGIALDTMGDVELRGVTVDSPEDAIDFWQTLGSVLIADSDLSFGDAEWGSSTGFIVQDSSILVTNGGIWVQGAVLASDYGVMEPGGPITFTRSQIHLLDDDLTDGSPSGNLDLQNREAPITLENNTSIVVHGHVMLTTQDDGVGTGAIRVTNNDELRVGVFTEDDPANHRVGDLRLTTNSSDPAVLLELANNQLAVNGAVELSSDGLRELQIIGNRGVIGDENTVGALRVAGTGRGPVAIAKNDLNVHNELALSLQNLNGGEFFFDENKLKLVSDGPVRLVMGTTNGTCRVTGNVIEMEDRSSTSAAVILGCFNSTGPFAMSGNTLEVRNGGVDALLIESTGSPQADITGNVLRNDFNIALWMDAPVSNVSSNEFHSETGTVMIGNQTYVAGAHLHVASNEITHQTPPAQGFGVYAFERATVENNTATVLGAHGGTAAALALSSALGHLEATVTNNTFTGYYRALDIADHETMPNGLNATIKDNTFDFPITSSPQAGTLRHVGDAIDARENQWGDNTDPALVATFVEYAGTTVVRGGSIQLSPLTPPPAGP